MGIHRRQRVVEEVDVGVTVHGPGQAHALLLAPRQVHALGRHTQEVGLLGNLETRREESSLECTRPRLGTPQVEEKT